MAALQADVISHAEGAKAWRITRTEIAIDVVKAESGIGQCTLRTLCMQLCHSFVGRLARGMFVGACNTGFSSDGHIAFLIALNLFAKTVRHHDFNQVGLATLNAGFQQGV